MTLPSSNENQVLIEQSETKVTLKEIILKGIEIKKYLMSKFLLIITLTLVGGILGYLYVSSAKPIYTATTSFVLQEDDNVGGFSQLSGLASLAGLDMAGGGGSVSLFQGDNLLELYKSRKMIQSALLSKVDSMGSNNGDLLVDMYIKANDLRKKWAANPLLRNITFHVKPNGSFTRLQDSVMERIVNDIRNGGLIVEKVDKKVSIINVSVKSQNEVFSKIFNDRIVQTVNKFYVNTKTKKSLENLSILQHQTDSVRNVLNGAIYKAVKINDATPNLNPTRQVLRVAGQSLQFNAEGNKAILTQLITNLEVAKINLRKDKPLIQVIDNPTYPLLKLKKSRLKAIAVGAFFMFTMCTMVLLTKRYLHAVMA